MVNLICEQIGSRLRKVQSVERDSHLFLFLWFGCVFNDCGSVLFSFILFNPFSSCLAQCQKYKSNHNFLFHWWLWARFISKKKKNCVALRILDHELEKLNGKRTQHKQCARWQMSIRFLRFFSLNLISILCLSRLPKTIS